jgi:hypothetical protein
VQSRTDCPTKQHYIHAHQLLGVPNPFKPSSTSITSPTPLHPATPDIHLAIIRYTFPFPQNRNSRLQPESGSPQISSMPGLTSAAGLIGLLDEPDQQLRSHALKHLNEYVDQFWAEIADEVPKM